VKLKRGDKVKWWSHTTDSPRRAVFVEYDQDFPDWYCILAIRIGVKPDQMIHTFRWPLGQVANDVAVDTINRNDDK
jgi:hypothetical protein